LAWVSAPSRSVVEEFKKAEAALNGEMLSTREAPVQAALDAIKAQRGIAFVTTKDHARSLEGRLTLPSFDEVRDDKRKFAKAAYFIEYEASPYNGRRLVQYHGSKAVVIDPPALPLSTEELDSVYEMPFTKEQHPSYKERIPAADMMPFFGEFDSRLLWGLLVLRDHAPPGAHCAVALRRVTAQGDRRAQSGPRLQGAGE
jgi:hypothetical protein